MHTFKEVIDRQTGERIVESPIGGRALLDCPLHNKGSGFSEEERRELGLLGLLPARVSSLEEQSARRYAEFRQLSTDLDRFIFLRALQDRNETLFYRLLQDHLTEMMPIIYTPGVGDICQRYSHIFHLPRGLYIPFPQQQDIDDILGNRSCADIDVIVVTDGERILGLGDQGVGGMGIPEGKLALYTLCGGVDPGRSLPILLDVGTNNAERLQDPDYLGWRHPRVRGPEYDAFIEAFIQAVVRQMPNVLLQWEDFAHLNARKLLDRYHDRLCTFNDDIQGTAAVTVAALLSAVRVTGSKLSEQQVVVLGAGAAATGIGDLLAAAMAAEGIAEADARSRMWLLNSRGLLHIGMDRLEPWQHPYRQPAERVAGWQRDAGGNIPLSVVVEQVRPTVLIGVSGQPGTFTQEVVRTMARHCERPIIFPLSNPTSRCEAVPSDLVAWTEGHALIATGSPFAAVPYNGRTIPISQCNNSYVFPGLGLGVIAAGARRVTDRLFLAAARALSDFTQQHASVGAILPPLEEIRSVSRHIGLAVGVEAQRQGLARQTTLSQWEKTFDARCWEPRYRPMRRRR